MILKCKCHHEQQDAFHGKGMRVHNETAKKDPQVYRCTVCGAEQSRQSPTKAPEKK